MTRRTFLTTTTASLAVALAKADAADPTNSSLATSHSSLPPTTARIWRGRTPRARADDYANYLYTEGVLALQKAALRVQLFREDRPADTEFVVISYWESVEAMSRYAGPDYTKVHPLPRDPEFLIELPKSIQVMQITADLPGQ